MKIFAVSQRVDLINERDETRDALDQRLIEWLLKCDCLGVPVPNKTHSFSKEAMCEWIDKINPYGLVLSGGNDVGRCLDRDGTEKFLLDWAAQHIKPVLGICRGMQMMAIWAGATLKKVNGHIGTRHSLRGEVNCEVNSFHQYSLLTCPSGFQSIAFTEDGEIEAIRHESFPWEGWMWHPERETYICDTLIRRFKMVVDII